MWLTGGCIAETTIAKKLSGSRTARPTMKVGTYRLDRVEMVFMQSFSSVLHSHMALRSGQGLIPLLRLEKDVNIHIGFMQLAPTCTMLVWVFGILGVLERGGRRNDRRFWGRSCD